MLNSHQLAEQSSQIWSKASRLERVEILINRADLLNIERKALEDKIQQEGLLRKIKNWSDQHQKQLRHAYKPDDALMKLVKQKDKSKIENRINNLLIKIHDWGVRGYEVIVQTKQTITGQELIYHIQDSSHTFKYTLNEQEFLQLLSSNSVGMKYASWAQIDEAIQKGYPKPLDLFKLNVGASKTQMKQFKNNVPTINLKRDALYRYLVDTKAISRKNTWNKEENSEYAYHARLSELHSQLLASYKWVLDEQGNVKKPENSSDYFFSKERKRLVDSFIRLYKKEGLHKDTDKFYETGDATLNESILIENKVGNAVVSISTVKNAIISIASLKGTNSEQRRQHFLQMFTKGPSGRLTTKIQGAAYEKAVKSINELFKS